MIQYESGELLVSKKQLLQIEIYIALTGGNPKDALLTNEQRYVLPILEAFDNNPIAAAHAWQKARKKGRELGLKHSYKLFENVPFPEATNFFQKFSSTQEAKKYWEKARDESAAISRGILEKDFFALVERYHSEINDKLTGVQ